MSKVNTRQGGKEKPLSEDELEVSRQNMLEYEKRLKAEAAALQREREEFERKMESENYRHPDPPNPDTIELLASFKNEILRELKDIRRDVDTFRSRELNSTPLDTQRSHEPHSPSPLHGNSALEDSQTPKVSFREATDTVPIFDGYNIPLAQFVRACRRAREIVPSSSERNLTKILINKLRGRAYYAVEDEPCDTITQLVDLLTGAFGSPKTIDQYRGELSTIFLKREEHMLDYISRVKDLRTAILDAERRAQGTLTQQTSIEVDALTARSFCNGLPLQYRLQMKPEHLIRPFEAFSEAKSLAKREELDRQRYESRPRAESTPSRHAIANQIRRPSAHSAPERGRSPPKYRAPPPDRTYGSAPRGPDNFQRSGYPRNSERQPTGSYRAPENRATYDATSASHRGNEQAAKWCRYCKNPGHEIEECRKREYNNSRANQGNSENPSGTVGEPRAGTSRDRPIRTIEVDKTEDESQS